MRLNHRWLLAASVTMLALAACGDDDSARRSDVRAAQTTPGGAASPTAFAVATAQTLPVTPVSTDYFPVEPPLETLRGARLTYGTLVDAGNGDDSGYIFEVPDDWNGTVVYYAHGFRANPPDLTITPPPLRQYFIDNGYAWAASSYTKNGYEPGAGARDTQQLKSVFERNVGAPERSYLYGQSMGGHVVALTLEQAPGVYDGALTECGVVAGREILDYFTSWGALASYFTGIDLIDSAADFGVFGNRIVEAVYPALGPADALTPAGRAFANTIMHLTGGPRPFFWEGFKAHYVFNFTILVNAVATAGAATAAADNRTSSYEIDDGYGYTTDQVNREVSRIAADPAYLDSEQYPEFAPLTGQLATPHLTIHNTGDLFVPISLEASYRNIVEAAGDGDLLVQRAVRRGGHCNFTDEERIRAFDDLVAWVERGVKPAGEDLTGSLLDVGRDFTSPLGDTDPDVIAAPRPPPE